MVDLRIEPSCLTGDVIVPSSKSHTLRAIVFATLSEGVSKIERFLDSPDIHAMIHAVSLLGADVHRELDVLHIRGCGGKLQIPNNVIDCGNAGQVLRFIGALAGLLSQYTILTGDASIRNNRPVKPLLEALQQLGVSALSSRGNDHAPILIKGPVLHRFATLDGQDSQPVSGLLIAAAYAPHPIELQVTNPGEKPWIDLTLHWFDKLGIPYSARDYTHYRMEGNAQTKCFTFLVPGDMSTAVFPVAAALLTSSEITLHNIDLDDVQGDKAVFSLLERMGARMISDRVKRTLCIKKASSLEGIQIDVNDFIDALPILAVIGCVASGRTEIVNGAISRKKESDRISCMARELKKMGARIEEKPDGLVIYESKLHGAELDTHCDHRVALSLSVAAMAASTPSTIRRIECINKTYGAFIRDFQAMGAKMR